MKTKNEKKTYERFEDFLWEKRKERKTPHRKKKERIGLRLAKMYD